MTNNYVRCDGQEIFFDDRSERQRNEALANVALSRKACVWRRPTGREWRDVREVGESWESLK